MSDNRRSYTAQQPEAVLVDVRASGVLDNGSILLDRKLIPLTIPRSSRVEARDSPQDACAAKLEGLRTTLARRLAAHIRGRLRRRCRDPFSGVPNCGSLSRVMRKPVLQSVLPLQAVCLCRQKTPRRPRSSVPGTVLACVTPAGDT